MKIVGITGTIASGKTTMAGAFAAAGVPVFDADAAVHAIYDNPPAELVSAFPDAAVNNRIDRARLAALIEHEPATIGRLEQAIHPLVRERAVDFVAAARRRGDAMIVLDVPLLFEGGYDTFCDITIVASAPEDVRRTRLDERGTMSEALYRHLRDRQMTDDEKRRRADYVVDTSASRDEVAARIGDIMTEIGESGTGAKREV